MSKKSVGKNPASVAAPLKPHYSNSIRVEGGPLLFISGQVALDKQSKLVGKGDIRAQATQALENIIAIIEANGGTMNNKIVYETYNCFYKNKFSVIRINFRGVEKSDGIFDNGQGELSDAAAALDWLEKENPGYSQCWVSGFSFGSLICMQLIMRRPEVNKFIAISPQPNVYDFTFLAPCPTSGQIIFAEKDELVSKDSINTCLLYTSPSPRD